MKIFLSLILFLSFLVITSCSELPQTVSTICDITQEICYYSNLICDNFSSVEFSSSDLNNAEKRLKQIEFDLNQISLNTAHLSTDQQILAHDKVYARLSKIRDDIKALYLQSKK